jgi:hypothetical protein
MAASVTENKGMGIDEIRRQKGEALLEFYEASIRVSRAAEDARRSAASIEEFAKLLYPDDIPGRSGPERYKEPNVTALHALVDQISVKLAILAAEELRDAVRQLAIAKAKKSEYQLP